MSTTEKVSQIGADGRRTEVVPTTPPAHPPITETRIDPESGARVKATDAQRERAARIAEDAADGYTPTPGTQISEDGKRHTLEDLGVDPTPPAVPIGPAAAAGGHGPEVTPEEARVFGIPGGVTEDPKPVYGLVGPAAASGGDGPAHPDAVTDGPQDELHARAEQLGIDGHEDLDDDDLAVEVAKAEVAALVDLGKEELATRATALDIKGRSRMGVEALASAIYEASQPEPEPEPDADADADDKDGADKGDADKDDKEPEASDPAAAGDGAGATDTPADTPAADAPPAGGETPPGETPPAADEPPAAAPESGTATE